MCYVAQVSIAYVVIVVMIHAMSLFNYFVLMVLGKAKPFQDQFTICHIQFIQK